MKLGFIGLGKIGSPVAGHLARQGYEIWVQNRNLAKAELWLNALRRQSKENPKTLPFQLKGHIATTPKEVAEQADILFCCVTDDAQLKSALVDSDHAAIKASNPPQIIVDHSSVSQRTCLDLGEQLSKRNIELIDAPVSGGETGAINACLSIMCGGNTDTFNQALPLFNLYAKHVQHMGALGNGQLCKMVNQICVAGVLQGLSEGLHFAECAGLEAESVFKTLTQGAAGSWQMQHRHQSMHARDYDFGFAVDLMRKDLRNVINEAKQLRVPLPLTCLVDQFYARVQLIGGGRWDTCSLVEALRQNNPIETESTQNTGIPCQPKNSQSIKGPPKTNHDKT